MKKAFIEKVKKAGVVDTRKYRYIYKEYSDKAVLKRAAIEWTKYPWIEGFKYIKCQIVKEGH